MTVSTTEKVCGKCLKAMPCPCAIAARERWENDPAIPQSVKDFIRAYAVMAKVA